MPFLFTIGKKPSIKSSIYNSAFLHVKQAIQKWLFSILSLVAISAAQFHWVVSHRT